MSTNVEPIKKKMEQRDNPDFHFNVYKSYHACCLSLSPYPSIYVFFFIQRFACMDYGAAIIKKMENAIQFSDRNK